MTRFIVVLTIDRHAPGTDVTDLYDAATLDDLVRFGYVEAAPVGEQPQAQSKPPRSRRKDGE
jgi:hypothetical protein